MSMSAGPLLRETSRLYSLIQRIRVACCDGTTLTQCHILGELGRSGPMTLMDLRNRLSLDKGWLSRAVDGLAAEGLVTKESGKVDRRTISLTLSPAGRERFQALNDVLDAHATEVMARIAQGERENVLRALRLVESALRAELEESGCKPVGKCSCQCDSEEV